MATPDQKYTLTPEHFARARADLDRRRAQLNDSHEAAVAAVAGHETAKALLDDELAKLETDERTASEIAKRYSAASDAHPPSSPPGRARPARRSNSGRRYRPNEDARIKQAARGELEQLARDLERPYSGVISATKSSSNGRAWTDRARRGDPDGSGKSGDCRRAADAHEAAAIADRPRTRTPVKRGTPVSGLIDDGPGRGRILDPVAYASGRDR